MKRAYERTRNHFAMPSGMSSTAQTRSGVAGMSRCCPPSASTTAFITAGSAPAHPASPHPFTPARWSGPAPGG